MTIPWQMRVYDNERLVYQADLMGPAEVGRQQSKDEKQPSHLEVNGRLRVVIAPLEEVTISRRHLEVNPQPDGQFLITNRSTNQNIGLPRGEKLAAGATGTVSLPIALQIGRRIVRLQALEEEEEPLASLPMATLAPGTFPRLGGLPAAFARSHETASMEASQLMNWVQAFLGLLHSAAGSEDFYIKAARAAVELVKLDCCRVLIRVGEEWQEQASHYGRALTAEAEWRPSQKILGSVLREKKTFWQVPDLQGSLSIRDIAAVVAAPILNRTFEVIGALYGERRLSSGTEIQSPISQLEALLVEVLASGVAAGLARVEHEKVALRARLQMEQFFTPRLAAKLADHPELLTGRDTWVSVLFCDIRGFSRITEKLGSAKTVEWMSDVMGCLCQIVLDHDGVVVDQIGDELMVMWGAPEDQPNHAVLACRTALALLDSLPALNDRWRAVLQEPIDLGIGINSGFAQVGNVGSKIKFKYGALGNTVNLASRVQGATKHLKTPLLITESTRAFLDDTWQTRRLCQVRVVNIRQPVTLFELIAPGRSHWASLKQGYEHALEEFTQGKFRETCRTIGRIMTRHPDDGPSLILLSRAVACLVEEPEAFDPVMVLPGK